MRIVIAAVAAILSSSAPAADFTYSDHRALSELVVRGTDCGGAWRAAAEVAERLSNDPAAGSVTIKELERLARGVGRDDDPSTTLVDPLQEAGPSAYPYARRHLRTWRK